MLISDSMNAAINEQIGNEFSASLQYVSIASHFASETLPELAAHFYNQSEEERDHAMRFVRYVVDAGGRVEIPAIAMPKADFKSVEEAVQISLEQEKTVTQQINDLVELSLKESDHITHNFLAWFLTEQLEEVSSMQDLLKVVQRAGDTNLLFVEDYLARRKGKAMSKPAPLAT
ncbi:MAG: ferritin [Verrucomicrobia bacterium]|nr:ferritin [Verrucomicrobiota bacterium]